MSETFLKLVLDIAGQLPGWHIEDTRKVSWNYDLVQDGDSGCLVVCDRGAKIEVYGTLGRIQDARGEATTIVINGRMGASKIKGPAKLAQDITRRILPDYLAQVKKAQGIVEAWNTQIEEQDATATRLAKVMGIKIKPNDHGRLWLYREHRQDKAFKLMSLGLSIDVEVSRGDYGVKVTAEYLRPEEAEAAIQTILAMRNKEN